MESCHRYYAKLHYSAFTNFRIYGCAVKCKNLPRGLDKKPERVVVFTECVIFWEECNCNGKPLIVYKGRMKLRKSTKISSVSDCSYMDYT